MDLISSLFSFGHGTLSYLVPFLIVLTVVVFFHELGHFLVARFFGVKIEAFSIGFGPELYGRNDRRGTRWRISAIPLGGYVKFLGDETLSSKPEALKKLEQYDDATRAQLFHLKPVGQRALIVLAGPVANFLLTILIFASLFMVVGKPYIEPRVGEVLQGSPAETAGFKVGDLILSIDGSDVRTFFDLQRSIALSDGRPLNIKVERAEKTLDLQVTPRQSVEDDKFGGKQPVWRIGLQSSGGGEGGQVKFEHFSPPAAVAMAASETWFIIERTVYLIGDLFAGQAPVKELGGPIRIAQASGQAADAGPLALMTLMAILSVSIGLLNLFPIPMLDGGHLVFYAIEAVLRRPLNEKVQEIGFRIGLALVLMLMVLATWNDVSRLVGL